MKNLLLFVAAALTAASAGALPLQAKKITAGRNHSCALTVDGGVACWGDGTRGQLGNNLLRNSSKPQRVIGLSGVKDVAAGGWHTCALLSTGKVKCWGAGKEGQLGYGTEAGQAYSRDKALPVSVANLSGVTAISAGDVHTCALLSTGDVKCWGTSEYGQLGDGQRGSPGLWRVVRSPSQKVLGLNVDAKAIAAGGNHTCALTVGGDVYCWGNGTVGQMGNGTRNVTANTQAVRVQLAQDATAIDAAEDHACAIVTGGALKCWGDAYFGQIGDGSGGNPEDADFAEAVTPTSVHASFDRGVTAVASGRGHTCVLQGGAVKCLGDRTMLELGPEESRVWITPTTRSYWYEQRVITPKTVAGLTNIRALAAGHKHTCALDGAGSVKCWGHGFFGQLGNGLSREAGTPQLVKFY